MDDNMIISSSCCSSSSSLTIQQKLKLLFQNQQHHPWIYAIFWQTSTSNNSNVDNMYSCPLSLIWKEGHYCQGMKSPTTNPKKEGNVVAEGNNFNSRDAGSSMDDVISDAEWFYMTSPSKSYPLKQRSSGALAKACTTGALVWLCGAHSLRSYNCERAKEAHSHGLHTFVCIPVSKGVLELGSVEVIQENWPLIQQVQSLFGNLMSNLPTKPELSTDNEHSSFYDSFPSWVSAQPGFCGPSEDYDSDGPISREKVVKKRGRKPGVGQGPVVNHVEAERQRREKMNSRFYALRSVVPTVTRMDKASLLADAVVYINELKDKVSKQESQLQMMNKVSTLAARINNDCNIFGVTDNNDNPTITNKLSCSSWISNGDNCNSNNNDNAVNNSSRIIPLEVDVKVLGNEAIIRVQCENVNHPAARLMNVLEQLNLQVHHASVCTIEHMMLQDIVIVDVPQELNSDDQMKVAIISRLER